ncbi:MAG: serine/threonine-protein kinase [Planctomycetota bacterium]|nr:serine/threonine-protein kinase [Planctomycetota bacterium]
MATLRVRNGALAGEVFAVHDCRKPTVLGRDTDADIHLPDERASRKHSQIFRAHGAWVLQDLGSRNGTLLNGTRVEKARLTDRSKVQIGSTRLRFHTGEFLPPPARELSGIRLLSTEYEEAGVFVHRAFQNAMDREVRVDRLTPAWQLPGTVRGALERAAQAAEELEHPGVAPLISSRLGNDDSPHVVLRDPPGTDLGQLLQEVLGAPLGVRLRLLGSLVDSVLLRAASERLRTPLSLRQIHVERDGEGFRVTVAALELPSLATYWLGALSHLPCYAPYLPPELGKKGENPGAVELASVVYSLGAVAYHLVTAQPPMGNVEHGAILENHQTIDPAPANLVNPEVPGSLSELIQKMLAKDPRERPPGGDLLATIETARRQAVEVESPAAEPRQSTLGAAVREELEPVEAIPDSPRRAREPAVPRRRPEPADARDDRPLHPLVEELIYLPLWIAIWVIVFLGARWATGWLLASPL